MPTALTWPDRLIAAVEQGLRAMAAPPVSMRPSPAAALAEPALSADERSTSAALMRVNHAGEIAAQALYSGQALFARSPATERTAFCRPTATVPTRRRTGRGRALRAVVN